MLYVCFMPAPALTVLNDVCLFDASPCDGGSE